MAMSAGKRGPRRCPGTVEKPQRRSAPRGLLPVGSVPPAQIEGLR